MLLTRLTLLVILSNLSGCFYLVPEGKGGVAERFPIPDWEQRFSERLHRCEIALTQQHLEGTLERYPALYKETEALLNESRRLYNAEYYLQAELSLEPVEVILNLMQQGMHLKAVSQLCRQGQYQEVCL